MIEEEIVIVEEEMPTVQLGRWVVPVVTALVHAKVEENVVRYKASGSQRIGVDLRYEGLAKRYFVFAFGLGDRVRTALENIFENWEEPCAGYKWGASVSYCSYERATKLHVKVTDPKEPVVEVRPVIIAQIRSCPCGHKDVVMPWSKTEPTKVRCIHCERLFDVTIPKVQALVWHELSTRFNDLGIDIRALQPK